MVDVALGLTVSSDGIAKGADDLVKITKAAAGAERAAGGVTSSTKAMSSAMSQALASLRSVDANILKLTEAQKRNNNETRDAIERQKSLSAQYVNLRSAMDPLYATSKKYEAAIETLDAAQREGIITDQERARSQAMLDAQFQKTAVATDKLATGTSHASNVFAQFNDIGMMAFAGQSPMMLAIQQGTQLNQVFAEITRKGGGAKELFATMRQAVVSMISPMSLLTLGAIAAGAAVVQFAMSMLSSGTGAKTSADAIDALSDSVALYVESAEAAKISTKDLVENYGTLSLEAKKALDNIADADRQNAIKSIGDTISLVVKENIQDLSNFATYLQGYTEQTNTLARGFNLAGTSGDNLLASINRLNTANGLKEQAQAASQVSDELLAAYGEYSKMPPVAQKLHDQMQQITLEAAKVVSQTDAWSAAMSSVLSYVNAIGASLANIGGVGISYAAMRVETEALRAGKTLREASLASARETAKLEGERRTAELTDQLGVRGKILGVMEAAAAQLAISQREELAYEQDIAREREREEKKKPKDGSKSAARKAAAELKAAEKGFQTIRELMEKESMFQFAEYEKRQGQLDEAMNKRLLTEQNYQMMSQQLRTLYFGAEYEVQALQYQMDLDQLNQHHANKLLSDEEYYRARKDLHWQNLLSEENRSDQAKDLSNTAQYFGQLYSLTGSSFEGMLKLQKSFAAAAALINAWQGYTTVLADPTVSFWMKLAAAGKVLSAGLGAVSAIKGTSMGGGSGGGSAGGGSSAGGAAASTQPTQGPQNVMVDLRGVDESMRPMVQAIIGPLIEGLQKQSKYGVNITGVRTV